ncbi:deoxynucleotide monophosphate kinase family protein [Streptomyces reniochalinae]|uniref:Adenylate kinase n=1 Tax=Streptomyces reniochalinae TaxID=2250578 RepID=A0A367EH58_9ACTN|nr:hypothetical protein [Streptomyces reniochalinae]RCG16975.1 hypothetical protein DQ392_18015 [Streptomyces reniochalinae]
MSYRNIALTGKARSGKDSVAKFLVRNWAFTRIAFADPLKGVALRLNPVIPTTYNVHVRLKSLVADVGWEYAKDNYPEVRRVLQTAGQTVRDLDPDFWVNVAMDKVDVADTWNMPVVVTDCRYPNEAEALKARGFTLVRVQRPGNPGTLEHESETALDDFPVDRVLINGGTLFDLETEAHSLVKRR